MKTNKPKTREYNWIEKEIDEIRMAHYEKTKHLSRNEFLEQSRKESRELAKKYGFKIVSQV